MQCSRVLITGVLVAAGMFGCFAPTMAQGADVPVEIRVGSCDDPGDVINVLADVPRLENAPIGASDAIPAASSFSSLPLALETLTGVDHIVLVPSTDGDNVLACGAIGGAPTANGALIIGLEAKGRGGLTGIAYFSANSDPSFTDVSVFLAGRSLTSTRTSVANEQPAVSQNSPIAVPTSSAPVAQQGLNSDEQAYIDEMIPIMRTITSSMDKSSELFQDPRIGDDDWTIQLATQFVIWDTTYDEASAIVPPPAFASIHNLVLESLSLLSSAGDDIATGIDTFDPILLEQGANKITQAASLMVQATDELNQLRSERGL